MGEDGGEADSAVLLFPPLQGTEEEPRLTFLKGGRRLRNGEFSHAKQTSDHGLCARYRAQALL